MIIALSDWKANAIGVITRDRELASIFPRIFTVTFWTDVWQG